VESARAHIFVKGRVQGVFFRAFTHGVAVKLGLHGWVKNLYDGRVEAVFEGDRALIEKAILECRQGPSGAYVDDIDLTWETYSGQERGFEVRY
jgi:acylphosphatase